MAGGGKGGKTIETQNLPLSLETGAQAVLASALDSASLKYKPNRGITIAAMSPMQEAAMKGAEDAAGAFGMPSSGVTGAGQGYLPEPKTGKSGAIGYNTGGLFNEMRDKSMQRSDRRARANLLAQYARDADRIRAIRPGTMSNSPDGGGK